MFDFRKYTSYEKDLIIIIFSLTIAAMIFVLMLAAFTPYVLTPGPVLMITGWFFGAMMTFFYDKKRGLDRS